MRLSWNRAPAFQDIVSVAVKGLEYGVSSVDGVHVVVYLEQIGRTRRERMRDMHAYSTYSLCCSCLPQTNIAYRPRHMCTSLQPRYTPSFHTSFSRVPLTVLADVVGDAWNRIRPFCGDFRAFSPAPEHRRKYNAGRDILKCLLGAFSLTASNIFRERLKPASFTARQKH